MSGALYLRGVVTINLINLRRPLIIFRYFGRHISTFCPTSTLKTECVLHSRTSLDSRDWTTERETTGHKL